MQNMDVFESVLILEQAFNRIEVMSSSRVHNDAWRLINDEEIFWFANDIDREVEDWRFYSDGCMDDLISIFEDIVGLDGRAIDSDVSSPDGIFVVVGRVGLKLLDERGEQFLPNPATLGKGAVDVGIRLYKPKGVDMEIIWSLLLSLVFLHRTVL